MEAAGSGAVSGFLAWAIAQELLIAVVAGLAVALMVLAVFPTRRFSIEGRELLESSLWGRKRIPIQKNVTFTLYTPVHGTQSLYVTDDRSSIGIPANSATFEFKAALLALANSCEGRGGGLHEDVRRYLTTEFS